MEAETKGADPSSSVVELEDHVSDHVHVEDSPRISTCTEVIAFSETVDLQAERDCHDAACINTTMDDQERGGTERERPLRTAHGREHDHSDQAAGCRTSGVCVHRHQHQGGSEHCNHHRDRPPSMDINDYIQPSSTTNLCDTPVQCADVVGSSDVTSQTTNLGQFLCMLQ